MTAMRLIWLVVLSGLAGFAAWAAPAPGPWEQPAANLAEQISGMLGPGQARLTSGNLSTIPPDEIPSIRRLLEQDLKARGVTASGTESANAIRITLSENARERLWVAEVIEGSETRVAMVHVDLGRQLQSQAAGGLMLRRQAILTAHEPVLAILQTPGGLVALEPEHLVKYANAEDGWREQARVAIGQSRPLARDARGILQAAARGQGFEAWLAGMQCAGDDPPAQPAADWLVHCHASDDPWPILAAPDGTDSSPAFKAFYNAARNYFTGVVTPAVGVDLPPFYSATLLSRSGGEAALLVNGIDGKVQLAQNGALKPVAGARDWGSDFAALHSGCGAGTQIVATGSGQAARDSLRAYEIPAQEAVPASAPLALDGTVTALFGAPDGKSVLAVVRGATNEYEVDRVTAICN